MVSSHKNAIRQAALFEARALNGRLLVCSFNLDSTDPASAWLKSRLVAYAQSEDFQPEDTLDAKQLRSLSETKRKKIVIETNYAYNPNDN